MKNIKEFHFLYLLPKIDEVAGYHYRTYPAPPYNGIQASSINEMPKTLVSWVL